MTAVLWTYQVIDANSRVVPGAQVSLMQGFRKGPVFHDPEMRTPARNPHSTDGAGRVALYLKAGETYEITIETPRGERWQFTHVARADGEVIRETVTETVEVPVERIVERVVTVDNPEQAKRIAELEAMLAAASAPKPEPVAAHIPPAEIADLINVLETPEQTNLRLAGLYAQAMNKAELARSYGTLEGRSPTEWIRQAERYESGLKWNRGRMAETL